MSNTSKRRNSTNKVNRRTTSQRRNHTNLGSVRELLALYQQLRDIEISAVEQIRYAHGLCRKYLGVVDGRYTTPLLEGSTGALVAMGRRLDGYSTQLSAAKNKLTRGIDATEDLMNLMADFSDEQLLIDTNIYKPLHDIHVELNKHASAEDQMNMDELHTFISSFSETLTTGEKA